MGVNESEEVKAMSPSSRKCLSANVLPPVTAVLSSVMSALVFIRYGEDWEPSPPLNVCAEARGHTAASASRVRIGFLLMLW